MKRIIIAVLIMLFIASTALSEQTVWNCPECGRTGNTGNYCGGCGHPAPNEIIDAEKNMFLSQHKAFIETSNDDPVEITSYVQDSQSWWDNKITVYLQDPGGAYFAYEMACTEKDASRLVPGTKICVKGYKGEWTGEIEIVDSTFEFMDGEPYIAQATDVTALMGSDDLKTHMNEFVIVKGTTILDYNGKGAAFEYKNPEAQTDDLYFKVKVNGQVYDMCVEYYLRGKETDVYKMVESLKVGDVVDVEGFLYWYNGPNLQATSITAQ